MDGDVLSQDEVDSLLTTMKTEPDPKGPEAARTLSGANLVSPETKVVPYDFKRPERVGKEQMKALQSMHEGFGRNFGAKLSALLRNIVEVRLTSVDQLTYSEFIFSLENPTCFNLITAEPLDGNLILDVNPTILYPIIDRLLGGGKEETPMTRRPLTEIEVRLATKITTLFLDELKNAWAKILPLTLSVDRVESNPHLVQIVPPNEVIVLISFELTLGEQRGMMNLCIPFNSIERLGDKLESNNWVSYGQTEPTPQTQQQIRGNLDGAVTELIVTLAETNISTADLLGLRVGDIITTEKDHRDLLDVAVSGRKKFRVSAGAFKGHKAFQVQDQPTQQEIAPEGE